MGPQQQDHPKRQLLQQLMGAVIGAPGKGAEEMMSGVKNALSLYQKFAKEWDSLGTVTADNTQDVPTAAKGMLRQQVKQAIPKPSTNMQPMQHMPPAGGAPGGAPGAPGMGMPPHPMGMPPLQGGMGMPPPGQGAMMPPPPMGGAPAPAPAPAPFNPQGGNNFQQMAQQFPHGFSGPSQMTVGSAPPPHPMGGAGYTP